MLEAGLHAAGLALPKRIRLTVLWVPVTVNFTFSSISNSSSNHFSKSGVTLSIHPCFSLVYRNSNSIYSGLIVDICCLPRPVNIKDIPEKIKKPIKIPDISKM